MNRAEVNKSQVEAQKALEEASKAKPILTENLPMSDKDQAEILSNANAQAAQLAADYADKNKKAELDQ